MKYVFRKKLFLIGFALFGAACNQLKSDNGSYKVRIPLEDGAGHYSLQTVEIKSVPDIINMSGSAAVILEKGNVSIEEDPATHKILSVSDANFGHTPSAHFLKVGDVFHPSDFVSLSLTTDMYHFERIRDFYDSFGGNKGLRFPRRVLYDFSYLIKSGQRHKELINNAAYWRPLDSFYINPYDPHDAGGVPVGMNGGVLAHEYLHSIFQIQMDGTSDELAEQGKITGEQRDEIHQSGSSLPLQDEWIPPQQLTADHLQLLSDSCKSYETIAPKNDSDYKKKDIKAANMSLFMAINEAVADYYGYEYSHNPAWILPSLPKEQTRVLSAKRTFDCSAKAQREWIASAHQADLKISEHEWGAYFAHFLFEVARSRKAEGLMDATKIQTREFLDRFTQAYVLNYRSHILTMGEAVRLFMGDAGFDRHECEAAKNVFTKEWSPADPCTKLLEAQKKAEATKE